MPVLKRSRVISGTWEGLLDGVPGSADPPAIDIVHLERVLPGLEIAALRDDAADWRATLPIPAELLSDGVQTFVIRAHEGGETLGHFTIVTGQPLEDDIRAELDLLRAELDMLKRAFRRHCRDT
ncbi:hypothetical protein EJA01_02930 [Rhodovulum iodosum]|nr:hypothetical protein EJA01_02930 [Rhodovulum robiginosum]